MLLEVAADLDAEAEAIETGDRAARPHTLRPDIHAALLYMIGFPTDPRPVQITKLSIGGAKFRTENVLTPGSRVILELPDRALRLDGTISRAAGADAAMVFDPASSADPALTRLLHVPA